MIRIHREGIPTLVLMALIGVALNVLAWASTGQGALWVTVPLALALWGFFAHFFRNPARSTPPAPERTLFSPADGTVVDIQRVMEGEYFGEERLKISIYMSPLNVHLNRVPFTGAVQYYKYHPGKYLVAFHPKASELNERSTVVFANYHGDAVLVRQIAGFLARRIVTYTTQAGQAVKVGDEMGFIKFGSRCDVFLPLTAEVLVTLDQKVKGGETRLADFK